MKLSPREIELQDMRIRKHAYMNSPERLAAAKAKMPNPFQPEPKPAPVAKPKQVARKKSNKKIGRKRASANRT